jgi:FAD/FMN-containing dehydrogenase
MENLETEIKKLIVGEVDSSQETLELFSHDASMFELKPQLVVYPKDSKDVSEVIKFVAANKKSTPSCQ